MFSTECIKTDLNNPFPNFETIFIINYLSLEYMDLVIEVYTKIINAIGEALKQQNGKFGPLAKTRGGVRTGLEGPIELIGDQKCQNNESFF